MAKSDGTVYVNTLMDTKGFGKGVNTMQKQIGGLSGAIGKLGGVIAATFAVGKIVQFGKEAIELGSDLQEVQNVVDVTFTTMNEQVNEFARNAAQTAGLSETMAKRYTGTFGAMAKAFGFAEGEAFDMSTSLTQLAGDVASFYNITQDEAYTKLKSVFTGETETLKDLGVVMTQSALDAYAMAEGYGKTTKQMSEQEKVALRYSFVLDQLSAAQGDFARTSDSWANQTRILSLNFDSFKANIGQALINIFTPFLKVINQIVAKMAQLSHHFVAFSEMLVGKSTSGGGGSPGDALTEIESGYEDIADATDEAAKAQKGYLTGLDEIKTYTPADSENANGDIDLPDLSGTTEIAENEVNTTTDLLDQLEKRFPRLIQFLKDTFGKIKEIILDFVSGDFFEAGQDVSDLVVGIFDFFSEAIDEVGWESIGNKIGEFLAGIDWIRIIKSALTLKYNIWKAIAEVWFGAFEVAPLETAIITAFMLLKLTPLGGILSEKIISAITGAGLVGKIKEALSLTFGGAGTLSESLTAVFGPVGTTIAGIVTTVGGAILAVTNFVDMLVSGFSWLNEILMIIGIAIAAIGAVILGAPAAIAAAVAAIVAVIATIVVVVKDNWDAICKWFSGVAKWFDENVITPIVDFFKGLWETVSGFFENLWEDISKIWGSVSTWFSEKVIEPIVNFFRGFWERIQKIFEGLWIIVQAVWEVASTWFDENVIAPIIGFFEPIVEAVGGFFSQLWEDIKNVWNNVSEWFNTYVAEPIADVFSSLWNGIKNTFASVINAIISGIESAINFIINGINGAINGFNGVVSWAAGVIGVDWGGVDLIPNVTLPRVNIPALATGAVIPPNAPFVAVLGDQKHGTNIEAPLATIEQAVRNVVGNGNGGSQFQFTAQINRRTLFDEIIEEAKLSQSKTGRNPFDLKPT